jgi:ribose 5-phosphate isomerase A
VSVEDQKRDAGFAAVDRFVRDGMCIGLGTGSTALWAIRRVGEMVARRANITAVPTSRATEDLCRELHIPVVDLLASEMAVAIDGADEVAADYALTKGGGGALFREKSVALAAARYIVIVDEKKLVDRLGAFPTPIEVVPFAVGWVKREIARLHPKATIERRGGASPFVTDNGNAILDCRFGTIDAPANLASELRALHGVVDTGLFIDLTDEVVVAGVSGVRFLRGLSAS